MEYVLNDNLSKEKLMNLGFFNYDQSFFRYYKILYSRLFYDAITLSITINLDTNEFNISISDESDFLPYLLLYNERGIYFYNERRIHIHTQDVLNIVKINFDKEMNILVENGVFKKKDKVKTL